MQKNNLRIFSFLKNFVGFFDVLIILYAMFFILYWIQNLIGVTWKWMSFTFGLFDSILYVSKILVPQAISNLNGVFKFEYVVGLLFFVLFYFVNKGVYRIVLILENFYKNMINSIKKFEENRFNKNLAKEQKNEQVKINKFFIYVKTTINKRKSLGIDVNLEEQNRIMNKFLIEQTSTMPKKYNDGYLFEFNDFSFIDGMVEKFFKLLESTTPLDYLIIVQAYQKDFNEVVGSLEGMISFDIKNKITLDSETAYRYSFNEEQNFEISKLGIYQRADKTIEVMCFEKKCL